MQLVGVVVLEFNDATLSDLGRADSEPDFVKDGDLSPGRGVAFVSGEVWAMSGLREP